MPDSSDDERYLELLLNPLDICARYTPKFGTNEKGVSLELRDNKGRQEEGETYS